jgi:hypothetical protein
MAGNQAGDGIASISPSVKIKLKIRKAHFQNGSRLFDLQPKEPPHKIGIETHDMDKHKKGGCVWNRGVACAGRNHGDCLPAQHRKPDRAGWRKTCHRKPSGRTA